MAEAEPVLPALGRRDKVLLAAMYSFLAAAVIAVLFPAAIFADLLLPLEWFGLLPGRPQGAAATWLGLAGLAGFWLWRRRHRPRRTRRWFRFTLAEGIAVSILLSLVGLFIWTLDLACPPRLIRTWRTSMDLSMLYNVNRPIPDPYLYADDLRMMMFREESDSGSAIVLWSPHTGRVIRRIEVAAKNVRARISANGERVVVNAGTGNTVYDVSTGRAIATLAGGALAISPEGRHVVVGEGGEISLWQVGAENIELWSKSWSDSGGVQIAPEGRQVIIGANDPAPESVMVWDGATGEEVLRYSPCIFGALSPDSRFLAFSSYEPSTEINQDAVAEEDTGLEYSIGKLEIYDLLRREFVGTWARGGFGMAPFYGRGEFSPDSSYCACGGMILELETRQVVGRSPENSGGLGLLFSPGNNYVVEEFARGDACREMPVMETGINWPLSPVASPSPYLGLTEEDLGYDAGARNYWAITFTGGDKQLAIGSVSRDRLYGTFAIIPLPAYIHLLSLPGRRELFRRKIGKIINIFSDGEILIVLNEGGVVSVWSLAGNPWPFAGAVALAAGGVFVLIRKSGAAPACLRARL